MAFAKLAYFVGSALLVAACGGSAFSGSNGEGGSGNASGSAANQAGKTSSAGSGSVASAGSSSSGGKSGTGGTASVAGAAGGLNCAAVACAEPLCTNGAEPIIRPNECCPSCPAPQPSCADVVCQPVEGCAEGYELKRPDGACCEGCIPKPGGVGCSLIACPEEDSCPLGYVRGDALGGCCYDCLPDPLFCRSVDDCVTADRPRPCCGCPEAISERMYDADPCWSDIHAPRMIPQSCYPQMVCDAVCGACPMPGNLQCNDNRCALAGPK